MATSDESITLTAKQAAFHLAMSEAWLRKAVYRRIIPFVRIGRAVRFRRADLDAFLESRRIDPRKEIA